MKLNIIPFFLITLTLLVSACGTVSHPSVSTDDVATRLGAPEYADEIRADATYPNFCKQKECDGAAMTYTKAFYEATLLVVAVDELVRQSEVSSATNESTTFLEATAPEVQNLRRDIDGKLRELATLRPSTDLDGQNARATATTALTQLNHRLRSAQVKLDRVERTCDRFEQPETNLDVWSANDVGVRPFVVPL